MHGLLAFLTWTTIPTASAAEVAWDGHYRTQVRYFDSLSLSAENEFSEGASWWTDHRLRLQPGFLLSDKVSLYTEFDILPFVTWGDQPVSLTDPATGNTEAMAFAYGLQAPAAEDGSAGNQNIQVRRAWGQLETGLARIRFGRMPVEWGSGMVYNAGNDPLDEYGDTADRVQVTAPVGPVYLIGAFETSAEQFINETDDLKTMTAGVAWLGEKAGMGTYNTYRWQNFDENSEFRLFTGDLWAKAEMGQAKFEFEFAFQLGGGDLNDSINDVRVTGVGTQLTAILGGEKFQAGMSAGIASGDQDPFDTEFHTFAFDPDFDLALMMFEEPMPVLLHENPHPYNNGGREYGAVRLGEGVRNAMYIRPTAGYRFDETFRADVALIAAQAAKVPESQKDARGYGSEVDVTLTYTPFDHFALESTTGVYMPGKFITEYEHDDFGGAYTETAIGSRLVGTVRF